MNIDFFLQSLIHQGIFLSNAQVTQFERYYELLVEVNQSFNLTAITDHDDVYLKHFYDSLSLAFYVEELRTGEVSLIDVGSGAGFPSLPLKIAFPNLKITMVDALNKRVTFLKQVVGELGLTNVNVVHGRAEDLAQMPAYRESFDFGTARAVARMSVLVEYTLPFVKLNGNLLVMKGSAARAELAEGQNAIKVMGGKQMEEYSFVLPNGDTRFIEVIQKIKKTPNKYPRQAGIPNKKPL